MKLYAKFRSMLRCREGNVMLEFAVGGGVLALAFTGIFQFGYTFYQYNKLEYAVDAGARYASMKVYDSATSTPSAAFQTAVKKMVVYGDPAANPDTSTPIVPGLAMSNVNLNVIFTNNIPAGMQVSINGYTIDAAVGRIVCNNKPNVTYTYVGIYSPY
jgi:Flp pilus assembly protein TadG